MVGDVLLEPSDDLLLLQETKWTAKFSNLHRVQNNSTSIKTTGESGQNIDKKVLQIWL